MNNRRWSILPYYSNLPAPFDPRPVGWTWDIFKGYYWTSKNQNWYAMICLFGPFILAKAIDWIYVAKK